MTDRILWAVFRFGDNRWPAYLVHPSELDDPTHYGQVGGLKYWAPWEPRRILINARYSKRSQDRALLHELTHVAVEENLCRHKHEEQMVTLIEGRLFAALTKTCRMRMPRRPRGTADLMRRSRSA